MAAALAYYTVFALPPLLILIMMIVGSFVSRESVQEALSGQVGAMIGSDGARTVQTMITQSKQPGASGGSLGMVLGIAFLLLVSLALSAALSAVGGAIGALIPGSSPVVVGILQTLVSLVVITLLFAAIFKVLPDAQIAWRDVWVGALVTAVLFEVGKWAIGLYLGNSNPGKAYGAAGSLAVLLVWIYYTAMIVLFGAEFTQTWATRRGSGIHPEEGAVKVTEGAAPAGKGEGKQADETPEQKRTAAAGRADAARKEPGKHDREPEDTPENQSGQPGGGVGRREDVGGSGVHPLSAGTAPEDAEVRTTRDMGGEAK
jgi:membrane protein